MPSLTIIVPRIQYRKIQERARREGFKTSADWARFLMQQNMALAESPRFKSTKIISEMQKTDLYKKSFLHELKKSLEYADKNSQRKSTRSTQKV